MILASTLKYYYCVFYFPQEDILSLELRHGLPRLLVDLGGHPIVLKPSGAPRNPPKLPPVGEETDGRGVPVTLADGKWHRLDLLWSGTVGEMFPNDLFFDP